LADRKIIVLTDDQGAMSLQQLRQERPEQYINVGIAEQNVIDVAAGMALGGMRPIVYGITNFVSLRCAEQISVSMCLMDLPVTIVASGGGLTYASDGPTHHATQDIALLRAMPGMTIFNPADAIATAAAARDCLVAMHPCYVRIEKGRLPQLYAESHKFSEGMELLRPGHNVLIVSSGFLVHTAMMVAGMVGQKGIAAGVLDLYRPKPVDLTKLAGILAAAEKIVVIEEQSPMGGIFSLVAETLAETGLARPVKRFSLPDAPCYHYGSREWLHREMSLSAGQIADAILSPAP